MPRVSAKRQITLPAHQCRQAAIEPGDEYRSFVTNGHITIVGLKAGSAWGCLRHLEADPTISDERSRQDTFRHSSSGANTSRALPGSWKYSP